MTLGFIVEEREYAVSEISQNRLEDVRVGIDEVRSIVEQVAFPTPRKHGGKEVTFR